jgi:hypothetical protein
MGLFSADCGAKENISIVLCDFTGTSVGVVDLILHASSASFPIIFFSEKYSEINPFSPGKHSPSDKSDEESCSWFIVDIQRTITGDRVSYSGVVCSLYFT